MQEDRSIYIQPTQHVETKWIDIDLCKIVNRERMDFAAIERAGRKYLQTGDCQIWPPIVGHWDGERFVVHDGRHEYLALLALGRTKIFVCWIVDNEPIISTNFLSEEEAIQNLDIHPDYDDYCPECGISYFEPNGCDYCT